eukprot:scaffold348462_cov62-Attheya_sp.AAC.8
MAGIRANGENAGTAAGPTAVMAATPKTHLSPVSTATPRLAPWSRPLSTPPAAVTAYAMVLRALLLVRETAAMPPRLLW